MYKEKEIPEDSKAIGRPKLNLGCSLRLDVSHNRLPEPFSLATLATELVKEGYTSVDGRTLCPDRC